MIPFAKYSLLAPFIGFQEALHWLAVGVAIAVAALVVDWLTRRRA